MGATEALPCCSRVTHSSAHHDTNRWPCPAALLATSTHVAMCAAVQGGSVSDGGGRQVSRRAGRPRVVHALCTPRGLAGAQRVLTARSAGLTLATPHSEVQKLRQALPRHLVPHQHPGSTGRLQFTLVDDTAGVTVLQRVPETLQRP